MEYAVSNLLSLAFFFFFFTLIKIYLGLIHIVVYI